ncbi:MAG: signal peptidase II [Bacteriovoracaceae bacterium]|nr:signal peptidase II [Bacteriovoracaceae bacterium]
MRIYKLWPLLVLIVFLILIDQLMKGYFQSNFLPNEKVSVIAGFFQLTYFVETSHSKYQSLLFLWLPMFCMAMTFRQLWRDILVKPKIIILSYSFLIGGAGGNLLDRKLFGHIVGCFDFYYQSTHLPILNFSDLCIIFASLVLLTAKLISLKKIS